MIDRYRQTKYMNTIKKFKLAITNPVLLGRKLNEILTDNIQKYNYKRNTSVFDKDWDNLIILDACRFDIAKQYDWEAKKKNTGAEQPPRRNFILTKSRDET